MTPQEIAAMVDELLDVYEDIEDDLLKNVAKRFSVLEKVDPETVAEWQTRKLKELGALREENIKILSKHSGKVSRDISRILTESGFDAVAFDDAIYAEANRRGLLPGTAVPARYSGQLRSILQAAIDNTRSYFNMVNTTALQSAQEGFLKIINQVYLEVSMGITDYYTATRKAVRQYADIGITGADYVSEAGRRTRNHIDVAVRRCIITSTSQTAGTLQLARAQEWGSNLVEVSSHMAARPTHAVWQGGIYSIRGSTREYPNLETVTGYGRVDGLKGANCGHDFYPYFEGLSMQTYRTYDKAKNAQAYKESQQQRQIERAIREQKRRILAAEASGDEVGTKRAQLKLRERQAEMKKFLSDTGRTSRTNRQQVIDFSHSAAMKAVWAERRAQ